MRFPRPVALTALAVLAALALGAGRLSPQAVAGEAAAERAAAPAPVAATVAPAPAAEAADVRRPKKLIAVGWDLFFDTAWLRAHHREMQERPCDGIVINVVGKGGDGKEVPLRLAFQKGAWKEEWFAPALADLKACTWTTFTDNFLMVWANPGDVDWFDDDGWRDVVATGAWPRGWRNRRACAACVSTRNRTRPRTRPSVTPPSQAATPTPLPSTPPRCASAAGRACRRWRRSSPTRRSSRSS